MNLEEFDNDAAARKTAGAMIANDRASTGAGMEILDVGVGRATIRMRVREDMVNGHGTSHGGYVFMLADTAFGAACNSHGPMAVAAGCDIAFLQPVHAGDELVAEATERYTNGRSGIYDVTVRRVGSGGSGSEREDTVVAEMRGRSRTLRTEV